MNEEQMGTLKRAKEENRALWVRGYRNQEGEVADYLLELHGPDLYPRLMEASWQQLVDMAADEEHPSFKRLVDELPDIGAHNFKHLILDMATVLRGKLDNPPPPKIDGPPQPHANLLSGDKGDTLINVTVQVRVQQGPESIKGAGTKVVKPIEQAKRAINRLLPLRQYGPRFSLTADKFTTLELA